MVGLVHSSGTLSPYYIGSIQSVLIADAITSPLARFIDPGGLVNRYVLVKFAHTKERLKALMQTTDYMLSDRYTDLAKSMFMRWALS